MALRLRHWLGLAALSFGAVAAWRLPLDYVPAPEPRVRSEAELRYDSLAKQLRQSRAVLDQLRRAAELPQATLSTATDRVSVIVPARARVDPEAVTALNGRVHDLVRATETRDPGIVVGYAYAADEDGAAGFSVREVDRYELFAGRLDGTPYCIYVRVARLGAVDRLVHRDASFASPGTLLGPCIQYAKHGLPGARIEEWLARGGVGMANRERLEPKPAVPPAWQRAYARRGVASRAGGDGSLFLEGGDSMQPERCIAGRSEVCAALFLHPETVDRIGLSDRQIAARSPALWSGRPHVWPFPADNGYLLSDLEKEFGPEAFHRFWTSDRDVRTAFEAAFDVDLGEWLVGWLDGGSGIEPATPAPTLSATFGSLLLIGLMSALATLWQKRRSVT